MAKTVVKGSRLTYIMIFGASGTVILAVLYFFLGRPAFKYADAMRSRFAAYQDKLQKAEELIHSVPNPQNALEDIERRNEEFSEASGPGRQVSRIIQELGQSAAGRQITVISIKPKEELKTGFQDLPAGVEKYFFEMTLSASYQEIGEYAWFLSTMPGVFTMETLTIVRQDPGASKQEEKTGLLNASFIISTYIVGES